MKQILLQAFIVGLVAATLLVFLPGCSSFGAGQRITVGKCDKIETPDEELNSCITRGWRQ
jgi:hypothetical protein